MVLTCSMQLLRVLESPNLILNPHGKTHDKGWLECHAKLLLR